MRVTRHSFDGGDDVRVLAAELRAGQPSLAEVSDDVAAIVSEIESGGDGALLAAEKRLGAAAPAALRVPGDEIAAARERVPPEVADALELAADNVRRVAETEVMADLRVTLPQGQSVRLRSVPVGAVGAYVPGGAGSYPSTALMCCIPARSAGVQRIAVVSPPGSDGKVDPAVLLASEIAGADEIYATGGAQAIGALALGTETIEPVDIVVGPGNRYVQEAKRQLIGRVGIDAIAGPSELMVVVDATIAAGGALEPLALDLCAQAEHGDDGLLVAAAADEAVLDALERATTEAAEQRDGVGNAPFALVSVESNGAAVELANAIAPEHLELVTEDADGLSRKVTTAGCVFIGPLGATAFGDYAAGSNHVLPTGGSGRFTGPLGPTAFRRRISTVKMTQGAARELAPVVATLARAEGFPVHGESVEARLERDDG